MQQLAKFELLAKIATGGMAEIWVARNRVTADICVVKKLLPQHANNPDYLQMFFDEGRIAALLNHPNIVQMFDFGTDAGTHYLAMEYLHGEDLRTVHRSLKQEGRLLPLDHVVRIVADACAGLHHAHEAKAADGSPLAIVHRDVSPHNVFVTFDGRVKVVDFGIAKSQQRDWETKHGTLKGKIPYMAPEQVKGRKLDRRSDIYALGIMLYELLLGRRPYILATSGDFALMMAIVRHDIRMPTQVDPDLPPELERIILQAMAYDPKQRYATAQLMQHDLSAFAKKEGLDMAPSSLSSLMGQIFGTRVEAWRAAQKAERDLVAHVVEVEEARAQSQVQQDEAPEDATEVVAEERSTLSRSNPSGAPRSMAPVAPPPGPSGPISIVATTSGAVASVTELFGVTVVTLHGRIDESFDGASLGGSLQGTVLLDLKGVERVTSFGVREWIEMNKVLEESGDVQIWLARCSEPIVTQMNLIQTFPGPAKVVSFDAPFLCDQCGTSFARLLDCETDAAVLSGQAPLTAVCTQCGGPAKLDDDPSSLAFAKPFIGVSVPEKVRALLGTLNERDHAADIVDKHVTEAETRVRIRRDVDRTFRWNRVFDGIEGQLVVDFRGVPRMSRDGAENLARALRILGPEMKRCEVVEAPLSVASAIGRTDPRVVFQSVSFDGRCVSCAATRTGVLPTIDLERTFRENRPPQVACRRCNAALQLGDTTEAMIALFAPPTPAPAPSARDLPSARDTPSESGPVSTSAAVTPNPAVVAPARASRPDGRAKTSKVVALLGAGAVVAALGAVAVVRLKNGTGPTTPSASAASSVAAAGAPESAAAPPASVVTTSEGVLILATGTAQDEELALAKAREAAIVRFIGEIEQKLPSDVREANAAADRSLDNARAAEIYSRQVGAIASPVRSESRVAKTLQSVSINAHYRLSPDAFARAVAFYSRTQERAAIRFAQALPTRGDALLVVSDTKLAGIGRGAIVLQIDGRATSSLDAFARLAGSSHDVLFSFRGKEIEAKLESR